MSDDGAAISLAEGGLLGPRRVAELLHLRDALLTREAVKTTEQRSFLVFAYVGVVLMLIQGFVYRRLVQRVGEVRFLLLGVVFMAAGLLTSALSPTPINQVPEITMTWRSCEWCRPEPSRSLGLQS